MRLHLSSATTLFRKMGLEYGEGYQCINRIYLGTDRVLAKLQLPSSILDTIGAFALHPALMDSALQASMGLKMSAEDGTMRDPTLMIPFAMESVEIFGRCSPSMWAYIRYSQGSVFSSLVEKADIDLCNEQGQVCVRIKGLSSRALENTSTIKTLFFEPLLSEATPTSLQFKKRKTLLCEEEGGTFVEQGLRIFNEIQLLLQQRLETDILLQVVVPATVGPSCLSALSALLKTAHLENPHFHGQLIETDNAPQIFKQLEENSLNIPYTHVRSSQDTYQALCWRELTGNHDHIPWKEGGVYLLTGGLGGLGWIFAKEIAHRSKNVVLILTGRSPLDEKKHTQLKELEALGAKALYRQNDVTNRAEVEDLIHNILQEHGHLNGILHTAGILHDNFIIKKTTEEFEKVLGPKVRGTVNLDEATKDIPLDVFILFSSGAGGVGNVGQADYALANAFMNAYAEYRSKKRKGKTLSMMWPLWKEGGMHVDAATEERIDKAAEWFPYRQKLVSELYIKPLRLEHPKLLS